jgi:hypothetical protein
VVVELRNKSKVIDSLKVIRRFYERVGWRDKVDEVDELFINSLAEFSY